MIKKLKMFHIDREDTLKLEKGEPLNIKQNSPNKPLCEFIKFLESKFGNDASPIISEINRFKYRSEFPVKETMDTWHKLITENQNSILNDVGNKVMNKNRIEIIFEYIRQKNFPNLPSRYECFFLTKQPNVWKSTLIVPPYTSSYILYTFNIIEVTKKFEADGNLFTSAKSATFEQVEEIANQYWKGENSSNYQHEVLFCGELKVIKKVDSNFKDIKIT